MIEGVDDAKEMAHTRQACTLLGNGISFFNLQVLVVLNQVTFVCNIGLALC